MNTILTASALLLPPLDVAPPVVPVVAISIGVIIALGLFVLGIVGVCVVVIILIKKKNSTKNKS